MTSTALSVAEVSFCLCLLIVGVNVERWKAQAALQPAFSG